MRYFILLVLSLFSLSSWGFSEQELVAQLQKPQSVQGEFIQQRYLKSLAKPIVTEGIFTLAASRGLLWHMQKPFEGITKVTSKGIMQWNGSQWVSNERVGQGEQIRLFLGLLSGDIAALKGQFDIQLSGSAKQWQLSLIPSTLLMQQIFKHIQVKGGAVVEQIELNETQGDRIQIQLRNALINHPFNEFTSQALQ